MLASRRGFLTGLIGIIAAPAVVRASSLMIIKPPPFEPYLEVIKFAGDGSTGIVSKVFGDPEITKTWWDMRTSMCGWGGPHSKVVQSIRYVTKEKTYEHGDYSWVPVDPKIREMRERLRNNVQHIA
jgi:hypothetical protein